jgi:hypothetical protein
MRHSDCIFVAEEDCPKERVCLNCDQCFKYKSYETIEGAVRDFTGLGEDTNNIFKIFQFMVENQGKSVEVVVPEKELLSVNRVMAALLASKKEDEHFNDQLYRRLIFCFFRIIIDEFEEKEYNKPSYIH